MADPNARIVGDWVLQQRIGSGSFAVVWKASHVSTGRIAAIKEISTDRLNKKLKQSLESEVSILKQIRHKNIVHLEDVIEVNCCPIATPDCMATALFTKLVEQLQSCKLASTVLLPFSREEWISQDLLRQIDLSEVRS